MWALGITALELAENFPSIFELPPIQYLFHVTQRSEPPKLTRNPASYSEEFHDFGTINEGDVVEHIFTFTNNGEAPLIIANAKGSCGCTVPTWPKQPIKPGESAKVVAKFNTAGKPNKQVKSITLFTNTAKGREVLTIRGNVTPKAKNAV